MTINADMLTELLLADHVEKELEAAWTDIAQAIPELGALAMDQGATKIHKDNVAHTIAVTAKTPPRLRVRLTALFHDVGKPPTREILANKVTFHNHEAVGGRLTAPILLRLGYDHQLASDVASLVALSGATKGSEQWTDSAVRRFVATAGDLLEDLLDFIIVDVTSRYEKNHLAVQNEVNNLRARIAEVQAYDKAATWRPVVSGDAIMKRYGLSPGPEVGKLLRARSTAQKAAETEGVTYAQEDAWRLLDALV